MERILGVGLRICLPESGRSSGHLQRRHRSQRCHRSGKHHGRAESLPVLAFARSGSSSFDAFLVSPRNEFPLWAFLYWCLKCQHNKFALGLLIHFFPQKYVLLASRPQKLFRHSFIASYEVYDIRSGARTRLQPSPNILKKLIPPNFGDGGPPGPPPEFFNGRPGSPPPPLPLLYATWSPKGSSLVYVFSNNVFYRASPTAEDVPLSTSGEISPFLNSSSRWDYVARNCRLQTCKSELLLNHFCLRFEANLFNRLRLHVLSDFKRKPKIDSK